tara:strand:- start:4203 stop:5273 length:1071 start_codon:yes stop_codon:yes gene_type:complete
MRKTQKPSVISATPEQTQLVEEIRQLIEETKSSVAVAVNVSMTMLYWKVGQRIHKELLGGQRASYGEEIVSIVSGQLRDHYGRGFSEKNIRHMIRFAEAFPDESIVSTLWRQLGWSHFKEIIYLKQPLQMQFYAQMCRHERWSVRALHSKINSMLYERTALSKKPEELALIELQALRDSDKMSPNLVFRDPYLLDFLELNDRYLEKDLEDAILRELEKFLLELGTGFAFLGRQKRIQIDQEDFYIDLLFYNRHLRRLIAIDLKIGNFKAEYKGQMELYLRWLDKHERQPEEDSPLGIILCAGKRQEMVELLELDQSGIHVAEYLTALPSKALLQEKLHKAIEQSRLRLENRGSDDE